ncbi:hypothetical protein ACHQM5_003743 [Ranunculus cassubicifolius]
MCEFRSTDCCLSACLPSRLPFPFAQLRRLAILPPDSIIIIIFIADSLCSSHQVDLLDFIDWTGVECLNYKPNHSMANALKQGYREDEGLVLESDADEQLLIYVPFTQVVK